MKTFILSLLTCLLFCTTSFSQHFITTWKTNNPGTSDNKSITIPTDPGSTYLYDLDWENDGIFDTFNVTGDIIHTYPTNGVYSVAIRGEFPRFFANNFGDRKKLLSVNQWGDNEWTNMEDAFRGCVNLTTTGLDTPDLSAVTSLKRMFYNATSFNQDISHWNVSTVTNFAYMFFNGTFSSSLFNQDISGWDVSSATSISYMFSGASSFNQDISAWDVSSVIYMSFTFSSYVKPSIFNQDLSAWDVSNVKSMVSMFEDNIVFNGDISTWDVSDVSTMKRMFNGAHSFNQDLSTWDVHKVNNMVNMFDFCGMDVVNFDKTIIGWAAQSVKSNVVLGAENLTYCSSEAARNILTSPPNNWSIGGTKECIPGTDCDNVKVITQLPFEINDSTTCGFFDNYQSNSVCTTGGISLLGEDIIWEYIPVSDQLIDIILNAPSNLQSTLIISADACFNDTANAECIATLSIPNGGLDTLKSLLLDGNRNYYIGLSIRGSGVSCGTFDLTINELPSTGAGIDCNSPKLIQTLPYKLNNWTTCGFIDNYPNNIECINGAAAWPGEDMIWQYTSPIYQTADIIINTESGLNSTLLVSADACFNDTTNAECITTLSIPNGGPDTLKGLLLHENRTYYIGLSMQKNTDSCGLYDININGMTASPPDHFIITWNALSGAATTIPTRSIYTYDYDVDWENDGTFDDFNVTGDITHQYPSSDTFTISIRGIFPAIHYENYTQRHRLLSIEQWGNTQWKTMESAFENCANLVLNATDAPDLSQTTNLRKMFSNASRMNTDISHWDVSTITNMAFIFEDAFTYNQDLSTWDVSNVTNMRGMFLDAPWFNQDIGNWNVSNVTDINFLFDGARSFNQNIGNWNVSSVTSMSFAFRDALSFNQNLGDWNISNVTVMNEMLHDCGLSIANYDSTLIGWASRPVQPGIVLDAEGLYYCDGAAARAQLMGTPNWSFLYDNQNCLVGVNCNTPIIIDSLPYQMNASTCGYINDYPFVCFGESLAGEDIIWKYTPDANQCVNLILQGTAGHSGHLAINRSCYEYFYTCIFHLTFPAGPVTVIPYIFLEANQEYFIAFSMHGASSCGNFNLEITDAPPGTNVWIGPADDDWFASADNWCLGHFPTSEENVLIPSGKTVSIQSGELGLAYTIEVEQGGDLNVNVGGDLAVVTD